MLKKAMVEKSDFPLQMVAPLPPTWKKNQVVKHNIFDTDQIQKKNSWFVQISLLVL